MKVWALWYGGMGYACGEFEDIEEFDSLSACKQDFADRLNNSYYPCVDAITPDDGGPSSWVFLSKPEIHDDLYPDRIIEFGPLGGVVEYRA